MIAAQKRIWVSHGATPWTEIVSEPWADTPADIVQEYVRSDLHDAVIIRNDALEAVINAILAKYGLEPPYYEQGIGDFDDWVVSLIRGVIAKREAAE